MGQSEFELFQRAIINAIESKKPANRTAEEAANLQAESP
jgi:hypothetical protein